VPKLLIVEDDELSREVLSDALADEEFEILTAGDGREGLDKVRAEIPDLVLLDIDMPKMDGIEVLKAIKEDPKTQSVPVIMVTAVNADSQIAMSLNLGAVDHIVKPYSSTVVRARVRAALRSAAAAGAASAGTAKRGTVVSFLGCKGGVGTTSLAYNVAVTMARQAKSVILCELSYDGGGLSRELGFMAEQTLASMIEDASSSIRLKDLEKCCVKQPNGLRVVVSAHAPDQLCPLTEEQTSEIVTGLATLAEHTIYDLPHIALPATAAALRLSDLVIIVLELDPLATHAAQITYERLRAMQISQSCIGAVVSTRAIPSAAASLKDVRQSLECPILGVIPFDHDAFVLATTRGLPLVEVAPTSGAAGAIASLTQRIIDGRFTPLHF
jgi:DNA-binding response OmpR family regulator